MNLNDQFATVRADEEKAAREEDERLQEISAPARREWVCQFCKADNPATFDVCWNCSNQR
jgi:hypothetical protein